MSGTSHGDGAARDRRPHDDPASGAGRRKAAASSSSRAGAGGPGAAGGGDSRAQGPRAYAPRPPGYSARLVRRVAMVLAFVVSTVVVMRVALSTTRGQAIDTMLMESAMTWDGALGALESVVEGIISVPALVIVSAIVAAVALLRRRPTLAGRAVAMVAGANATTQLLQHVLDRPDLGVTTAVANSLPSGHTTVAMSVALALVMVAPMWFREPAAWAGWAWASVTGVTVMVSAWHRPSDVVTALLVTGVWALALTPLEQRDRHAAVAQRVMGIAALVLLVLGIAGTLAATAGVDLVGAAAPGGGLGNYGFADFLAHGGWRTRLLSVSAAAGVVGVTGIVIHEVDRLSWS
ncbi:MAG: phosphatase PAP2 family protein [Actinomyces sp.]|nr:phosphatase PAP2 family protein [Actinomyces sp.]MCI1787280.1 phosphatase PAP2 family protein [Actinomyces sp.]MCI1829674.1 phosphatase PAP2 family protein [Actinomyces sp.]MCI1866372.1 phosphatase PAP2 family protein [Actinomyces sp.]